MFPQLGPKGLDASLESGHGQGTVTKISQHKANSMSSHKLLGLGPMWRMWNVGLCFSPLHCIYLDFLTACSTLHLFQK